MKGLWPRLPDDEQPVELWELVAVVVREYRLPADRVWAMTVSDLMLMLQKPNEDTTAKDELAMRMICYEMDSRLSTREKLTIEQRIELEAFKLELMR